MIESIRIRDFKSLAEVSVGGQGDLYLRPDPWFLHFRARAQRGAGQPVQGLALLEKAAGIEA